jgi:hypothetical protein
MMNCINLAKIHISRVEYKHSYPGISTLAFKTNLLRNRMNPGMPSSDPSKILILIFNLFIYELKLFIHFTKKYEY